MSHHEQLQECHEPDSKRKRTSKTRIRRVKETIRERVVSNENENTTAPHLAVEVNWQGIAQEHLTCENVRGVPHVAHDSSLASWSKGGTVNSTVGQLEEKLS